MIDWVTLGIWAVSTALYWLTPDPKKPRIRKEELTAPTVSEGSGIPVFWGTVSIKAPANVRFKGAIGSTVYDDYTIFDVQDVICLGVIDIFFGVQVGEKSCPYTKLDPAFGTYDPVHPDSIYQPKNFPNRNYFETFRITDHDIDANPAGTSFIAFIIMNNDPLADFWVAQGNAIIGMGRIGDITNSPYPTSNSEWLAKIFPVSDYADRTKLPKWNYLTQAYYFGAKFYSSVATRAYKVQRNLRTIKGDSFSSIFSPDYSEIYRYNEIVPENFYGADLIDEVILFNRSFSQKSVNPMYVIYDMLTSELLNLNIPTSMIDYESFNECAKILYDEKFGLNVDIYENEDDYKSVFQDIMTCIEGFMYFSLTDDKFHFKLARPLTQEEIDNLEIIDESDIIEIEDYTNEIDGREYPNSVTITYTNRFTGKNSKYCTLYDYYGYDTDQKIVVRNDEDIARRGLVNEEISRPWISDPLIAEDIAERYLFLNSARIVKMKATGHSTLKKYNIGDVVKLTWNRLGLLEVPVRVFAKTKDPENSGRIMLSLIEDIHNIQYGKRIAPVFNPDLDIIPASNSVVRETSRWERFLYALSTPDPNGTFFDDTKNIYSLFVSKANEAQLAYLAYYKKALDANYVLDESAGAVPFPSYKTFSLPINISGYEDFSSSAYPLNTLDLGAVILIGNEIIRKDNSSGIFLRGCYDTQPETHAIDDPCIILYDKGTFYQDQRNFMVRSQGDYNMKLTPVNGSLSTALSRCPQLTLPEYDYPRYYKPLNCTGIMVGSNAWMFGDSFVTYAFDNTDIVISWKNKSRDNLSSGTQCLRSIYDTASSHNFLEAECSYLVEAIDGSGGVIRTFTIPYTSQNPTVSNTQITYPLSLFITDFPNGKGRVRIRARRLVSSPSTYVYSGYDRMIQIHVVVAESEYPKVWFLYPKAYLVTGSPIRKIMSFKNILYPSWYSDPYSLMTTYRTDGIEPSNPDTGIGVSFTTGVIYPPMTQPVAGLTEAECISKTWRNKTQALIGGLFKGVGEINQSTSFFPPQCKIVSLGKCNKNIYVASNTDYWSDWFDTQYSYDLYLCYTTKLVPDTVNPNKGTPDQVPNTPFFNADIETNKISKYTPINVSVTPPTYSASLYVYAKVRAKLTRKADSVVFWTNDYVVKSWLPILTTESYYAWRTLSIFPSPTITVVETQQITPPRWVYTFSVSIPSGTSWESEAWQWRPVAYINYTNNDKPAVVSDPADTQRFNKGSSAVYIAGLSQRAKWIVCACDIVIRGNDQLVPNGANWTVRTRITPQSYYEYKFS